jgi:hypothetical protein
MKNQCVMRGIVTRTYLFFGGLLSRFPPLLLPVLQGHPALPLFEIIQALANGELTN